MEDKIMTDKQVLEFIEDQVGINKDLVELIGVEKKKISLLQDEINHMNKRFDELDKIMLSLSSLVISMTEVKE